MVRNAKDQSDLNLSPRHAAVVRLYTLGPPDVRGIASAAYRAVYGCTERAAQSGASRLFKRPDVIQAIAAIEAVRDAEAVEGMRAEIRGWAELSAEARRVIGDLLDNGRSEGVRLRAAVYAADRHEGRPRTSVTVGGEVTIEKLLKEIADEDGYLPTGRGEAPGESLPWQPEARVKAEAETADEVTKQMRRARRERTRKEIEEIIPEARGKRKRRLR
jgi:hypothetical protein